MSHGTASHAFTDAVPWHVPTMLDTAMHSVRLAGVLVGLGTVLLNPAGAQVSVPDSLANRPPVDSAGLRPLPLIRSEQYGGPYPLAFRSFADSLEWERARRLAERARGFRLVVSLLDRTVHVIDGADTVLTMPAAVASGMTLDYAGRRWTFRTPRGRHTVLRKVADPVWTPPDWLYAEAAQEHGLELAPWPASGVVRLLDGGRLVVRDGVVGLIPAYSSEFLALPTDEHLVFDGKLYIPPFGVRNRQVQGELGAFALDLGDGYLIHGTPHNTSIGQAVTHGCIRLFPEHIAWLYQNVRPGAAVYIY